MENATSIEAAGEDKAMANGDNDDRRIVRLLSALAQSDTDVLQILSTLGRDPEVLKVASLFVEDTRSAAVRVGPVLAKSQQMASRDNAAMNGFSALKNGRGDVRQTLAWLRNDTEVLHELSLVAKSALGRSQSDTDVLQYRGQSDTDVLQDREQSDTDVLQYRGQSDTDVLQLQLRDERLVLQALMVLGRGNLEFLQQRLPESGEPAALPLLSGYADKNQELLSLLAAFVAFQAALTELKDHAMFSAMEELARTRPDTVLALTRLAGRDFETLKALVKLV